ncbi:hypothetical protein KYJ24_003630 [Salmonella enterica]|nr:hypothetical protein [Salmonella enterica]
MQENDFFTWRRAMLLRFQEMAAAEDVYTELQYQTQRLEFDYYALCVRHPVPFTYDEVELRLQLLARESLSALTRFEDDMVMAPEMRFSKREKEILKWTAEGKTSSEIAIILSISENTVNFHQKNMQKKFNAPNKTQIACYAAATGLI